jgi:ethanolamine utilization protein EutM
MAAVKSATDAGAEAAGQVGEVVSVQVITRPHDDLAHLLAGFGAKQSGASGA